MLKHLKYSWRVLRKAGADFIENSCFRSSASLSYYTLFSIAPIVLITIYVAGIFVDDVYIRKEITSQFKTLIGQQGAEGIFVLMETIRTEDKNAFSLILGIVVLIISATTIFAQMQMAFNEVFGVKPVEGKKGFIKLLRDRVISLGMILSLGFIMIISLVLDSLIVAFIDLLTFRFKELSLILIQVAENLLMLFVIYWIVFALFRFLPDVIISRKYILRGAVITTILLLLGKFGIGWYIGNSSFNELVGASSSVIILMLWVYYCSVIIFFGAELIKAQAKVDKNDYQAARYATKVKLVEIKDSE